MKYILMSSLLILYACVPSSGTKSKLDFKETASEAANLGDIHSNNKIYTDHNQTDEKFYQPRYMDGSMFVQQLFQIFHKNWRTRYVINNSGSLSTSTERFSQNLRAQLGYPCDIYATEVDTNSNIQKFDMAVPYAEQHHCLNRSGSRGNQSFRSMPTIGKPTTETMGNYIKLCQHIALNRNHYKYRYHTHLYMKKIFPDIGYYYSQIITKKHIVKLLTKFLHRLPSQAEVLAVWEFSQKDQYNSGDYYSNYAAWQSTQEQWSRAILATCMGSYTALVL